MKSTGLLVAAIFFIAAVLIGLVVFLSGGPSYAIGYPKTTLTGDTCGWKFESIDTSDVIGDGYTVEVIDVSPGYSIHFHLGLQHQPSPNEIIAAMKQKCAAAKQQEQASKKLEDERSKLRNQVNSLLK